MGYLSRTDLINARPIRLPVLLVMSAWLLNWPGSQASTLSTMDTQYSPRLLPT
jgi:hypothetical protein